MQFFIEKQKLLRISIFAGRMKGGKLNIGIRIGSGHAGLTITSHSSHMTTFSPDHLYRQEKSDFLPKFH